MLEQLDIRGNALRFIEEFGTPQQRFITTSVSTFEQSNRPLAHINRLFGQDLVHHLELLNNQGNFHVLDLACGRLARNSREIVSQYPNAFVTGIDLEIDEPTEIDRLTLFQTDLLKQPLPKESADLVICYGFLDYLREKQMHDLIKEFFIKVGNSLKIGGVALVDFIPDYLDNFTNRFETPFTRIIRNQTGAEISSRSRKLPFGVRHPELISWSNLIFNRHDGRGFDNNYVFMSK